MKLTYEYRLAGDTTWLPINSSDIIGKGLSIKYASNGGSHYDLDGSVEIIVRGAFYEFIRQSIWLPNTGQTVDIEIRIYVVKCGKYLQTMIIDADGIKYCDGDCYFTLKLSYKDTKLRDIKQSLPFNGNIPRNFRYCEDRSIIGYVVFMTILAMFIITGLGAIILAVAAGILGSVFVDLFQNIRGCRYKQYGYTIQRLLFRTGQIVGLTYDATTDDIFIPKYPNHCITYYGKSDTNNYNAFNLPLIHSPNWNGYELLEFLKLNYNIKYRVNLGLLRIKNKFERWNNTAIDLTDEKFCYEFKELENPSLIHFEHEDDSLDGTDANAINYDDLLNVNTPTFTQAQSGQRDIKFSFARQRARADGVKEDKLDKVDSNTVFQAILGFLDAITPLDLLEDRTYLLNDSNNGVGLVRIVDWDIANSPFSNAKVVRQAFTPTTDTYYTNNLGLAGEAPDTVFLYGTIRNTVCNATVFTNEFLNTNALPNRIREFQDEYPQSAYQLARKNKRATATISSCSCGDLNDLGIFDGQEPIIDFWAITPSGEGIITEFEIDLNDGTLKLTIEI